MDKTEQLLLVNNNYIKTEDALISKYNNGDDPYYIIPSFEGRGVVGALNSMYIEHDFSGAKSHFYKAARVAEHMSNTYDWRVINSGINQISYALFSDNSPLIERYSVLKNAVNDESNIGYQLPNSIQNILLEDWEKLDWNIRCLERFVKFPAFKWYAGVINVLNGFRNTDTKDIQAGLHELLATHKKRNTDPLICKFFSIDTAGFTKMARIKGYQIDLQSILVPDKLMAINPLSDYPDFDFLKDKL